MYRYVLLYSHSMNKKIKNKAAQELGKLGGRARAKKHTREEMSKWGKLGGRPKKK